MKIFSNFDTKFQEKLVQKKIERFWVEKILIVRRSKFHLFLRVLLPAGIIILAMLVWNIYALYVPILFLGVIPFNIAMLLILWFRPWHRLLKHLYDFTVVDPHGVTTYKQNWFLHSTLKEIPAGRIRSIKFERSSFLWNVFWYGNIFIHTDFSEEMHIGEDNEVSFVIHLTYVDKPFKVKNQISELCFDQN